MNVAELIALLNEHPDDMEVLVQSYEEGYDPVTEVKPMAVSETPDKAWYVGVYAEDAQAKKLALVIQSRYNRAEKDEG